jgi:glutathione S-transferase
MTPPKLWSWHLSPFAGKARIALAYKQVEVELLEIDPVNRQAGLRAVNPANRVPVLMHGEIAIRESTPICEWAQETGPGPSLWPEDPAQRARARGLLRWVDDELTVNFFLAMRKEAFGLDPVDPVDLVAQLRGNLVKRWKGLEALLDAAGGSWLAGGESPSLADLAALPLSVRLPAWKPELAPDPDVYPLATAWLQTLGEHPLTVEVDRRGTAPPD